MKTKRIIAFITMLMIITMILSSCFMVNVMAEDMSESNAASNVKAEASMGNIEVSGTNSVGNILASELQNKQTEQIANNGYNIFSIEMEDNVATVDYQVQGDCTLIVGIYDDSATTMIASGTAEVKNGETLTTVEIPILAMPEYFYIKAYLIRTDTLEPLCIEYTNPNYTQHMQEFFSKTTDDFDEEKVINFDEDKTNNFAVYSGDVIIIPYEEGYNTNITYNEKTSTYIIENPSDDFIALKKGDIFSYSYEDNLITAKIDSIDISADKSVVTITEAEAVLDEVFDYVKVNTSQNLSEADVKCYDGAEYIKDGKIGDGENSNLKMPGESPIVKETELSSGGVIEWDFGERPTSKVTTATANSGNNQSVTTATTVTADNKNTTTTEQNSGVESEISGKIQFSFNSSAVIYFDGFDSYFELKFDYGFGIFLTINLKVYKNIPLADVVFSPIPSITITAKPKIVIEAEVELDIDYAVRGCIGFRADIKGVHDLNKNPTGSPEITLSGRVYIGIELDPQLVFVDKHLIEATLTANAGFEITAEISKSLVDYMDSDTYHECNLCVDGGLYFVASIDFNATFIGFFKVPLQPIAIRSHLFDFYYSIDNNEFGIGECPHILHRFEVDVKDANSNPIEDMTVTAKSDGTVKYLAGNLISDLPEVLKTDSDGKIVLFSNLSTDLTFEKDGYEPANLYVYAVKYTVDEDAIVYSYNDKSEVVDIDKPIVITIPYKQPEQVSTTITTNTTTSYDDTETTTTETTVANPEDVKNSESQLVYLEDMPLIESDQYADNEGDSFIYKIGEHKHTRGNIDINGESYTHGLEVWIARWNYKKESSWAYGVFDLSGKYSSLSGKGVLIKSYNTTDFDTTLEFIGDGNLIKSYHLTPDSIPFDIDIDVSNVKQLKVYAYDNKPVSGGTSFGLTEMILKSDSNISEYKKAFAIIQETPEILSNVYENSDDPVIITVKIKDLKPDTVYNYYKFHTTETDNLFDPSNFMYITQFKTDEQGFAEFVTGTNEKDDNAVSMEVCANSDTKSVTLGDVNQDGMIDATDASQILAIYSVYSTGSNPEETEEQLLSADVNSDGMVNASDASTILAYYAYLSTGGTDDIETFMSTNAA